MKTGLTKTDSQAIKGIAIGLMLAHHLFYGVGSFKGMPVDFFMLSVEDAIFLARFAKICVPLFVFVTAYGLSIKFKSMEWNRLNIERITLKRYLDLMFPFWFVFITMQIICNITQVKTFIDAYGYGNANILYFIFDAFGLGRCMHTPTLNSTWWYMSVAILLIFIMPLIWRGVSKLGYTLFLGCFIFFQLTNWNDNQYFVYILVAILGATLAEEDFFSKLGNMVCKNKLLNMVLLAICIAAIGLCLLLRIKGGFQETIFCISVVAIAVIQQQFLSRSKLVTGVLAFLGKHSMNIFLIHTFIKANLFHSFVYSFKYGPIIWLVLMIMSLICSICIDCMKKVLGVNKLRSKIDDILFSNKKEI